MSFAEEFNGMSDREILIQLYVQIEHLKDAVEAKPCPSPECLSCRERIATLETWKTKREAELAKDAENKEDKGLKNSWIWPTIVTSIVAIVGIIVGALVI